MGFDALLCLKANQGANMSTTAAMRLARAASRELHAHCSDAELLRRFVADRDEAAFRELLDRYEALVRSASLRITANRDAVDNAIQATFVTLAQKAHTIRHADALPSWLYRVARKPNRLSKNPSIRCHRHWINCWLAN
jgi:hypothetical protein